MSAEDLSECQRLKDRVAELEKMLEWCRHTIANADEIILDLGGDEDDHEEIVEYLADIDALLGRPK